MGACFTAMEVLVISAIPKVDSLEHIFSSMRVDEIDYYLDASAMGFVD